MNTTVFILDRLSEAYRALDSISFLIGDVKWDDAQLVRKCALRARRRDPTGWRDFMSHVNSHRRFACGVVRTLEGLGWTEYSIEKERMELALPREFLPLEDNIQEDLIALLNPPLTSAEQKPRTSRPGSIMYIEEKPGLAGHARIGRVTFSATRKTIYYAGRKLRSLKGQGYKANYYNVDSGLRYWISNCKKDGNDTLYPGVIEIDEDAREEYWLKIRNKPDHVHMTKFRSEGKYAKRRPS